MIQKVMLFFRNKQMEQTTSSQHHNNDHEKNERDEDQHASHLHNDNHENLHTSHQHNTADHNFFLAPYFEQAVEYISCAAGVIIVASIFLAAINLLLVFFNANLGTKFRLVNPFHHARTHIETATIGRIRLMLGEHTSLALGILVAADVLDTVIKPAHSYGLEDMTKMFFLMTLRTTLAYFLGREMKELEEEEEHLAHKVHENHEKNHEKVHEKSHENKNHKNKNHENGDSKIPKKEL